MAPPSRNELELKLVLERLHRDSNAVAVYLTDRAGVAVTSAGRTDILEPSDLEALAVVDIEGVEEEQSTVVGLPMREGGRQSNHLTRVRGEVVLVVVFDQRTSLGLVRLRIKKAIPELIRLLFPENDSGPVGGRGGSGGGSGDEARAWVGN
ncbi:MAG: hypothetical protein ABI333_29595 [bacterium]